jgi:predicted lipid-binding transport protein (Tim44 family)
MLRLLMVVLALAGASFTVTACGPFGGGSPEDALNDLKDAAEDGDEEKICELFTEDAKEQIEENTDESCEDYYGDASDEDLEILSDFEVKEVEESGDEATVTVEADGEEDEAEMKKEDGDWKIDEAATSDL